MFDNTNITVVPAYGRDYKSEQAVLDDWNANKDFRIAVSNGTYINKADVEKYSPGTTVSVRYNNLRSVVVIK